ncbi:hypothetical protein CFOL_v3_20497 [Cephalotus follicularis]|uniref:UBX domain-containing protein n=1 Tax=Cephalotus follicularis TaxID=3775 RepID=A0A1Q3C9Y9_CEPFO|nr:hypothetical protein CFOL_v3_20497 [Cephalotus follicularis]
MQVVTRVHFPDGHTLEIIFHSSETIQILVDLLTEALAQLELPFYICTYTTPQKQIKDMSQDFFSAGFVLGAIVYFAYDLARG